MLGIKKTRVCIPIIFISALLLLSGCSSKGYENQSYDVMENSTLSYIPSINSNGISSDTKYEAAEIYDSINNFERDTGSTENNKSTTEISLSEEKLVYTARMNIETLDFDKEVEAIKELISQYSGIIQREDYNGYAGYLNYRADRSRKHVVIEARIPSENYTSLSSDIKSIGHLESFSYNVDNITTTYYNKQSYLESYKLQLEELKKLYQKAETISDLIEVEARISEVQSEIDSLTTDIQRMDLDVSYSTLTISVSEVDNYTLTQIERESEPFFMRLLMDVKESVISFGYTLEDMATFLIYAMWYIAIIAIIVIAIRKAIKTKQNKEINEFMREHPEFEAYIKTNGLKPYREMKKYKHNIYYIDAKQKEDKDGTV